MLTCPVCGQENPDGFKFCGACGSPLAAPEPGEEERKTVTAVFTDIVGSTARAETMDPEDVRAMLAPYYARLRGELERFGGTVEKFIGDAVVAVFGAPVAHEDDPERAVRAALAIGNAVAALNAEHEWLDLHIRTAVNTGGALVVVGASAVEGEGIAAGDVMNTAARLQSAAPVDGIAVGEATFRATAHAFEYAEAEPIAAKGKAEPVPTWIVLGEKVAPRRPQPWRRLVAREEETAQLLRLWTQAAVETTQLVTILGAPGVGKSRLVVELSQLVSSDVGMYWGRCLPYGEGITYWPVIEIVKDAGDILVDDDVVGVTRKIGAIIESLPTTDRDELRTIAAALSNLLGVATTPEGSYLVQEIGQAELHWGIRRFLELRSNQRPLIVVFEDLHWAEPTLLELIRSFTECRGPMLVIGTARPELGEAEPDFAGSFERRHVLHLEPLGTDASLALLDELVGTSGADPARFGLLLDKAGGNPLFLEETVRMLADTELLDAETDIEALPVPESLQALIGSRLDALPGGEKRVAQQASVVGNVFWQGAVAHLAGSDEGLVERLHALEHRDFINHRTESTVVGEREYGFKHILIRDVAYERLPRGRRAELHVRFSEWVTGLAAPEHEFVEILAYHLEQACRLARQVQQSPVAPPIDEAAIALRRAGEKAERRGGMREANRYYARALELIEDQCSTVALDLRVRAAFTRNVLGEVGQAAEDLGSVADDARARNELGIRGTALATLGQIEIRQGHVADARVHLTEALEIAVTTDDRRLQVRAMFRLAALWADVEGEFDRAVAELNRGLEIAEQIEDRSLQIEGHLRLGFFFVNMGRLALAEDALLRCAALANETGSLRDDAQAIYLLGFVKHYLGEADEAERLGLQARDWLVRTGEAYMGIQNLVALAKYALARNDPDTAERWLREAVPLALEGGGGGWLLIWVYRHLTEALLQQGKVDDAAELVEFAGRDLTDEYPYPRTLLLLAASAVAAARGDIATATAGYEEVVRLLTELELPLEVAEARVELARVLDRSGDVARARTELEVARESFVAMEASFCVEAVDRKLHELELERKGAGVPGPLGD